MLHSANLHLANYLSFLTEEELRTKGLACYATIQKDVKPTLPKTREES